MATTPRVQTTAQLFELATLLQRKKQWLLYPPALGLVLAMIVTALLPKLFESGTLIEIKEAVLIADKSVRDPRDHPILRNLPNVASQIQDYNLLAQVVGQELQWPSYAAVAASGDPFELRKYMQQIADRVTVGVAQKKAATGDDRISIAFRDHDPERARAFVEALSMLWRQQTRDTYVRILEEQYGLDKARLDQLENERTLLTGFIDRIVSEGQLPIAAGDINTEQQQSLVDPEEQKLLARKAELAELEEELADLAPQLAQAQARFDELEPFELVPPEAVEEASLAPEIDARRVMLEEEKAALELEIDGMTMAWPKHKRARRLIAQIDLQLAELLGTPEENGAPELVRRPSREWKTQHDLVQKLQGDVKRSESRKALLTEQVRDLQRTVTERTNSYSVLKSSKRSFLELGGEIVKAKFEVETRNQVLRLLKSERGDPFTVTVPPIAGRTPVWPNTWLLLGAGILVGLLFGMTMVLLTEYGRLSFRSVEDATASLDIPVLGAVNRIWTVEELRRRRNSRWLSLSIAVMFLGAVAGFVYLYTRHPDRLPQSLTRVLDDLIRGQT